MFIFVFASLTGILLRALFCFLFDQNLMEVVFPRSLRKEGKGKALPYRDPFRLSYKPYWVPA